MRLPQTTIVGNLGADPALRFSKAGKPITGFTVAVTESRKVDDKWEDGDTTWWKCTAFGPIAENVAESFRKGQRVMVYGRVKADNWEDREGNKRTDLSLLVDDAGVALSYVRRDTPQRAQAPAAQEQTQAADDSPPPF